MFFLRQLKKLNQPIRWWSTSTLPSSSPSSPPPTPRRVDCSVSYTLLIRWLAAIFHTFRTCIAPGLWGRAGRIGADPSYPGHRLFDTSGRRLRSIRTKTSRHMNSFFCLLFKKSFCTFLYSSSVFIFNHHPHFMSLFVYIVNITVIVCLLFPHWCKIHLGNKLFLILM